MRRIRNVLVGTRFSLARGGQVPWERRRPRRHTVHPRPRRTGCTAFCRTLEPIYSSPPAETARRAGIAPCRFLCPPVTWDGRRPALHGCEWAPATAIRPQNSTPESAIADSPPPAGDRCPGSAEVLVGTRLSPARRDKCITPGSLELGFLSPPVAWHGQRPASHDFGLCLLCPPKKRADQKPDQASRVPVRVLVSPAGGLSKKCICGREERVSAAKWICGREERVSAAKWICGCEERAWTAFFCCMSTSSDFLESISGLFGGRQGAFWRASAGVGGVGED
jgi:hypothetical protein